MILWSCLCQECSCPETCHNEVEPFQLDDNFDYDNVVLSSKYTAEEMSLLARLRQTSTRDTQVRVGTAQGDIIERQVGCIMEHLPACIITFWQLHNCQLTHN